MQHYIIDANNLLGFLGRDRALEHIEYLIEYIHLNQKKRCMTLVFDGAPPYEFIDPRYERMEVVFQDVILDADADDTIVRYVKHLPKGGEVYVVTFDRELQERLYREGVRKKNFLTPSELVEVFEKKHTTESDTSERELDENEKEIITEELQDLWV
jgi:predicted RNA-binding protein with PIN domain